MSKSQKNFLRKNENSSELLSMIDEYIFLIRWFWKINFHGFAQQLKLSFYRRALMSLNETSTICLPSEENTYFLQNLEYMKNR